MPRPLTRRSFTRLAGAGVLGAALPTRGDRGAAPAAVPPPPAAPEEPVRLHFNENPYGPSPAARVALARLPEIAWQYPAGHPRALREALAARHGVGAEQVLLGNGSAEILQLAARAYLGPGRRLVVAEPTYEALEQYAAGLGAPVTRIALDDAWGHDVPAMLAAGRDAGLLYLCNPNNPTGSLTEVAAIRRAVAEAPAGCAVVVDEAYHHYVTAEGYESAARLVAARPHLIVLRTFSKVYGLAGLRIGYGLAQPQVVRRLGALQSRNNLNVAGLAAAQASLQDDAYVEASRRRNLATRTRVGRALAERGFAVIPSEANFLMADLGRDVRAVIEALRLRGVAVGRPFPPLTHHLRVTLGTEAQMDAFLAALDGALAAGPAPAVLPEPGT